MATFSNDRHSIQGRATAGAVASVAVILLLVLTGHFDGWPVRALAVAIGLFGVAFTFFQAREMLR